MTEAMIVAAFVLLAAYDVWVLFARWVGDRMPLDRQPYISEVMRDWGEQIYLIPYAWGALAGHFWLNQGVTIPEPATYFFLFGSLILPLGMIVARPWTGKRATKLTHLFLLGSGCAAGAYLWPMPTG